MSPDDSRKSGLVKRTKSEPAYRIKDINLRNPSARQGLRPQATPPLFLPTSGRKRKREDGRPNGERVVREPTQGRESPSNTRPSRGRRIDSRTHCVCDSSAELVIAPASTLAAERAKKRTQARPPTPSGPSSDCATGSRDKVYTHARTACLRRLPRQARPHPRRHFFFLTRLSSVGYMVPSQTQRRPTHTQAARERHRKTRTQTLLFFLRLYG